MQIHIFLSIFCIFCVPYTYSQDRINSRWIDGTQTINIDYQQKALAYASNFKQDQINNQDQIATFYFLADKGVPNLFTAQIQRGKTDESSFWSTGLSVASNTTSPFLTFDLSGKFIIGPAYPSDPNFTAVYSIQIVYLGDNVPSVQQFNVKGFTFYSTLIDPVVDSATSEFYVYFAGWASGKSMETDITDPFVIARGRVNLGSGKPNLIVVPTTDILPIPMTQNNCFDVFDEISHPIMNLTETKLRVLVPGRCAFFAEVTLPKTPIVKFSESSTITSDLLGDQARKVYLSSGTFDTNDNALYYSLKYFDSTQSDLYSYSLDNRTIISSISLNVDFPESEPVLTYGREGTQKYLWIVGSGASFIERIKITDDFRFPAEKSYATLTSLNNRVSSAYFSSPFLYLATYEPDAKIFRIHKDNFCSDRCYLSQSYCHLQNCACLSGFVPDATRIDRPCVSNDFESIQIKEFQNEGTAAALGVLLGFSIVAALAGWALYFKQR